MNTEYPLPCREERLPSVLWEYPLKVYGFVFNFYQAWVHLHLGELSGSGDGFMAQASCSPEYVGTIPDLWTEKGNKVENFGSW